MLDSFAMGDSFLSRLQQRASACKNRIVLPEATEPRTLKAAVELKRRAIAEPILVGEPDAVLKAAREAGLSPEQLKGIEIRSPGERAKAERYGQRLHERLRHKGVSEDEARDLARDPLVRI